MLVQAPYLHLSTKQSKAHTLLLWEQYPDHKSIFGNLGCLVDGAQFWVNHCCDKLSHSIEPQYLYSTTTTSTQEERRTLTGGRGELIPTNIYDDWSEVTYSGTYCCVNISCSYCIYGISAVTHTLTVLMVMPDKHVM